MSQTSLLKTIHQNEAAAKLGFRLFLSTEIMLFLGLFVVYGIYNFLNPIAFSLAATELSSGIGAFDTLALIVGSLFMIKGAKMLNSGRKNMSVFYLMMTLFTGFIFLINKYFEWKGKFTNGLFPGSEDLFRLGQGDVMFYGFYFFITGLQILHVIIGFILLMLVVLRINNNKLSSELSVFVNFAAVYWHFITALWVICYVLFYIMP